MPSSRRAVITGLGLISPIGSTLDSYWESLIQGRSGIRPLQGVDTSALPVRFGGEVVGFDARKYLDKKAGKNLRLMARTIQLSVAASQLALDDSKIDKAKLDPTRFGVEFGAGLIATELDELAAAAQLCVNCQPGMVDLEKWGDLGLANIQPLWMLKYLPNMLACHVSILHDAQGPSNTVTESDVAGLLALGEAFRIIGRDTADFFLVGGADSRLSPLSLVRQCLFQPLSKRNDDPARACRPFDQQRDGMVIGEGAGVLVLEDLDHANRRGARIYAEVVGFGSAFDRRKDGKGLARAIQAALREADITPADLDHVNAHGFSSIDSDVLEARGLTEALGSDVPVLAPKSYFGNLGAGGATTELGASLLSLTRGAVPATLNYENADPACPLTVIAGSARPLQKSHFLKVSFTDMGQCAAVVCKKWA